MSRVFSRYVHRATLGLPRQERLEAAAELRTHLMDRAARLEAEGFSREEAEHLAVKGMGDVGVTNRQLLGHVFTNRVAWAVLAVLVLGGGGGWVWQNVPLPGWGQATWRWDNELTTTDLARLYEAEAPRDRVFAADLRVPTKARYLYLALVPQKEEGLAKVWRYQLRPRDDGGRFEASPNRTRQARLLLTGEAWNGNLCESGRDVGLFVDLDWKPEKGVTMDGGSSVGLNRQVNHNSWNFYCAGLRLPDASDPDLWTSAGFQKLGWVVGNTFTNASSAPRNLPTGEWTLAGFYGVNTASYSRAKSFVTWSVPKHQHDVLLAVLPSEKALEKASIYDQDRGQGYYTTFPTREWKGLMGQVPRPKYRDTP
ncbi:hypothetical protein L1280_000055 [Deinococcus sp. HSC-46F16]|uniref:permease prefix domain 1-containing protein n=1 Tax=Deinococcus sp. HSC-46F16 TaxID=2910968 RepID=UPI00209EA218|nr:permease prefix domain 1-containing protein [Deinococcus sp. HSC-46F16]MCP2012927.1 hypothetical protein [Deinococcus sp. HSC-46F16]